MPLLVTPPAKVLTRFARLVPPTRIPSTFPEIAPALLMPPEKFEMWWRKMPWWPPDSVELAEFNDAARKSADDPDVDRELAAGDRPAIGDATHEALIRFQCARPYR